MALTIMEMRSFIHTWRAIDQAESAEQVPTGAMADRVTAAIAARVRDEMGRDDG